MSRPKWAGLSLCVVFLTLAMACQRQSSSEGVRELVDEYVAVWNTGEVDGLDRIATADFVLRTPVTDYRAVVGIDSLKDAIRTTRRLYPDFQVDTAERILANDSTVILRWTVTATHTGSTADFPATGRSIRAPGFSIVYVRDGKVAGEWIAWSDLGWMGQLGFRLVPEPSESD